MKLFVPACLAAIAMLPATAFAQPADPAPGAATKQMIPGLAIANASDVINASNALVNAMKEQQIVYKSQIAMAEARRKQIQAQIDPLVSKFNADRQAGVAQADLQTQAQEIQNMQQTGVQELQTMLAPVSLSEAYVREQINEVISKAITNAMAKKGVTFVVPPQNVMAFENAYNLSPVVLAELNTLLPTAKVIPPKDWQPKAVRDAQAAQQAQLAPPPAKPAQGPR